MLTFSLHSSLIIYGNKRKFDTKLRIKNAFGKQSEESLEFHTIFATENIGALAAVMGSLWAAMTNTSKRILTPLQN